jgi:hypothetical protein
LKPWQVNRTPNKTIPAPQHGNLLLYKCLQTSAIALALFALICLIRLGSASFVPFAFAGGFLIYLSLGPSVRHLGAIVAVASVYALGYQMQHGSFAQIPASGFGTVGAFLGLGSLIVKSTQWVWSAGNQKTDHLTDLGEIALLPALCLSSGLAVSAVSWFLPKTYDLFLYAFDSNLGLQPSFAVGRLFRSHPAFAYASACVYNCLPIYLAAFRAYQIRFAQASIPDVRRLFAVLGLTGFFLYLICPATGPVHCFKTFPDNPPSLNDLTVERIPVIAVPRNAIPSLHFGWAFLMCLYAWMRREWILGLASTIFVVFTALATLGSGEHYLIDLIVAVPLVIAVLGACAAPSISALLTVEVLIGSALTLGWLSFLRFGFFVGTSRATGWAAVAFTLLVSLALLAALFKRASVQSANGSTLQETFSCPAAFESM